MERGAQEKPPTVSTPHAYIPQAAVVPTSTPSHPLPLVNSLQPLPPRKDWHKLRAYDGIVLRYHASFAEPQTVPDTTRRYAGHVEYTLQQH